jgi:hypothetical protein
MSFVHRPYDGAKQPFTIGAEPLDPAHWIEPDAHLARDLALKDEILHTHFESSVRAEAGTEAAQDELRDLLVRHLLTTFPDLYAPSAAQMIHIVPLGRDIRLDDSTELPLVTCARLVQEDICLLRRGAGGWRLVAGVLCFPSGWSLAEKIGGDLTQIHGPVPGFAGRMAETVGRMFDRITPERPVVRWNWSIYGDHAMRQEPSHEDGWQRFPPHEALQRAHLRIERQTLRRLPVSGDLVFTIRIHSDALADLAGHPVGPRLAAGLRAQLLALDPSQLAYKGLSAVKDELSLLLERIAKR